MKTQLVQLDNILAAVSRKNASHFSSESEAKEALRRYYELTECIEGAALRALCIGKIHYMDYRVVADKATKIRNAIYQIAVQFIW
jgi:hypothetical protein